MQPTADRGPKPGDVIEGRYVLRDRIGEGGMGSVFLANQPGLERMVAVKVLHPELADWPEHARRLRDEARNACRVRSSNCVGVIDCGSLPDGAPYIVMEYVPGRSLGQVIAEEAIPLARAVDLMEQILAALGAAHDAGVIHGDVKSDNFLVETSGGRDHVTLIDFGLARVVDAPHEIDVEDGEVMVSGTPEYMAPEVVAGDPPVRASDLYAAGVILYELLTGVTPFGGGTPVAIMLRHAREAAVPPSLRAPELDLPPALDRVVLRALHKSPAAPTAAAWCAAPRRPGCAARSATRSRPVTSRRSRTATWSSPTCSAASAGSPRRRASSRRASTC
jgi:serine/threonine-protein kinase